MKRNIPRTIKYTPEFGKLFCEHIAMGRSVRAICANPLFPAPSTIYLWLRLYPEFSEQYARAKDGMAEKMFWDMLEIADNGENDTYVDEKGNVRVNHDAIARSKLRVDTRKWILARLAPKKYGDRSQLDLTSSDGSVLWAKMTDEEKVARLNSIHSETQRRVLAKQAEDDSLDGSDLV